VSPRTDPFKKEIRCIFTMDPIQFKARYDQINLIQGVDSNFIYNYFIDGDLEMTNRAVDDIAKEAAYQFDKMIIDEILQNINLKKYGHHTTFSLTPDPTYGFEKEQWIQNLIVTIAAMRAQIYNDTQMDAANLIIMHEDILRDLNNWTIGSKTFDVVGTKSIPKYNVLCSLQTRDFVRSCLGVFIYVPFIPVNFDKLKLICRYDLQVHNTNGLGLIQLTK